MISVIIPAYNAERTLDRCLRSVVAQTYKDWELIVINDGSRDRTSEICHRWERADRRITVFDCDNAGVGAARNRGLDAAKGDYYAFVDSDDEIEPTLYERMHACAEAENADMTYCGYLRVDPRGEALYQEEALLGRLVSARDIGVFFGRDALAPAIWRILFRRSSLGSIRFDPALKTGEDLIYHIECLASSQKIASVNEALYRYYPPQNTSVKYRCDDFIDQEKRFGRDLIGRLQGRADEELIRSESYKRYYNAVCKAARSARFTRAEVAAIASDEYFKSVDTRENYRAFCNGRDRKERLKAFLVRRRLIGLLRLALRRTD